MELLSKARKLEEIPTEVMDSCKDIIINGHSDSPMEFRSFEGKNVITFFNSLDYILDYSEVKNLSWTEVINVGAETLKELNECFKSLDSLTGNESKEEIDRINNRLALLRYKMAVIKNITKEKKGEIRLVSNTKHESKNQIRSLIKSMRRTSTKK